MNASGDKEWVAGAQTRQNGGAPDPVAVDAAFQSWLARAESDLLLVMDCDNRFLLIDLWDAIRFRAVDKEGAVLHSLQEGLNRGDGRDHTGYFDAISNLGQKIATDPAYYRSKVYLPHPAPLFPASRTGRGTTPATTEGPISSTANISSTSTAGPRLIFR
jgi:hypothetical protein